MQRRERESKGDSGSLEMTENSPDYLQVGVFGFTPGREREGQEMLPEEKQKQKGALCAPRSGLVGGSTTMGVAAWRVKEKNELKMRVIWLAFRGSTRRSKGACSSSSGYGEDDVCRVGCRSSS